MGVFIDRDDILSMHETYGVIRQLTRKIRVTGLTANDYTALDQALTNATLPSSPGPVPGSYLVNAPNNFSSDFSMLVLVDRKVNLVGGDPSTADIILEYKHFIEDANQILWIDPALPTNYNLSYLAQNAIQPQIFGKMRSSVQQTKTNFWNAPLAISAGLPIRMWHPPGQGFTFNGNIDPPLGGYTVGTVVDYNGFYWIVTQPLGPPPGATPGPNGPPDPSNRAWRLAVAGTDYTLDSTITTRRAIAVGFTFPTNDDNYAGKTRYQTGEVTIMQPHKTYTVEGRIFTRNIDNFLDQIIGHTNSKFWLDGVPWEWLCTEAAWDTLFVRTQFKVKLEFQHNPDSWNPTAVFVDQRQGRPPLTLIPGFGSVQPPITPTLDFNAFFGRTFEH